MSPRFGRPTAYVPPSVADGATAGAVESLDAFLELTPLDTLAADAARFADSADPVAGSAAAEGDAAHSTSPTPASTTASAVRPSSHSEPAPAGDAAPQARFQGAPQAASPETRAEVRITHHLRRDR